MNLQPHTGNACPVACDALVVADLGDGELIVDRADALAWGPGAGDDGEGRIRRYAVLTLAELSKGHVCVDERCGQLYWADRDPEAGGTCAMLLSVDLQDTLLPVDYDALDALTH